MYILFSLVSLVHCNETFFERLDKLRECAKLFELSAYDSIPTQCLIYAKSGLSRTRRSTHLYSKPKGDKCQKPCQKTRLYVKPKVMHNTHETILICTNSDIESTLRWIRTTQVGRSPSQ